MKDLKAGQYFIKVKNNAKSVDKKANFDVKTYAERGQVKLAEYSSQVTSGLVKAAQAKNDKNLV